MKTECHFDESTRIHIYCCTFEKPKDEIKHEVIANWWPFFVWLLICLWNAPDAIESQQMKKTNWLRI